MITTKIPVRQLVLSLACLFIFQGAIFSQEPPEGYIRYLAVNNYAKMMAALDYMSPQRKERNAYVWGKRSEWKSYRNLYFTATASKYEDSEEQAEPDDDGYSWRKNAYTIRRDFEHGTELDILTVLGKAYVVEDTLRAPDWKILNDMKEVAGHVCMNAIWEDTVKQQKIVVWFALDLPAPAGPERLCGLPGIILEADYNDGAMVITADKIELKKLTNELDPPKKVKGKKITEAGYQQMLQKHIAEKRKLEEPWYWGMRY